MLKCVRGFGEIFDDVIVAAVQKVSMLCSDEDNRKLLTGPAEGFKVILDTLEVRIEDQIVRRILRLLLSNGEKFQIQQTCIDIFLTIFTTENGVPETIRDHLPNHLASVNSKDVFFLFLLKLNFVSVPQRH